MTHSYSLFNNNTSHKQRKPKSLKVETLEQRQLLAGNTCHLDPLPAADDAASQVVAASPASVSQEHAEPVSNIELPADLPAQFSTTIEYAGETLTLQLDKHSVFGENTRFLLDDGSGELVQIDHGPDRSYMGSVAEHPSYTVTAWLAPEGLRAGIYRPGQATISVEPAPEAGIGNHQVTLIAQTDFSTNHDHDGDGIPDHAPEAHRDDTDGGHPPGCACAACCVTSDDATTDDNVAQFVSSDYAPTTPVLAASSSPDAAPSPPSIATLAPTRVMNVYEFEVGVEIGFPAFSNNHGGSEANAMAEAAKIPANLDARYLHASGVKHRLGTVIIRTSSNSSHPQVANGNDNDGLNEFRDYWNANPGEVGSTHDLAVYHVRGGPSGLAYVNSVGSTNRYALTASNGPSSWADGTLVHEFGHSWSLGHVNSSNANGLFYESRPRNNSGSSTPGGNNFFISPMNGSGNHNVGRFATGEALQILGVRDGKLGFGDLITDPAQTKPFGHVDRAISTGDPIVFDVIANDYDVNNDVLDAEILDTVSLLGGTVSLSEGTGPGGRNELIYTPPADTTGEDFFHYIVRDATGRSDWGAVHVTLDSPVVTVNSLDTSYWYDLGPVNQVVRNGYRRLGPDVTGDATWSAPVTGIDRGAQAGVGEDGHDSITSNASTTLNHKIGNGTWQVILNMGDTDQAHDNMGISAEDGQVTLTDIDRAVGEYITIGFQVEVTDGELNLTFSDADGDTPGDLGWVVNRLVFTKISSQVFGAFQFDFGPNAAGTYNGSDTPAALDSADNIWNAVAANSDLNTVVDSLGIASNVSIKVRETSNGGTFDFNAAASGLEHRTATNFSGIYGTELMNDIMFTRDGDDLGVQIEGLVAGDYAIYAMLREPDQAGRTYSVDIGTGTGDTATFGDFGLGNTTAGSGAPDDWTLNENYYAETVTIAEGESAFVLIDSTNSDFATLHGLQIVRLDSPLTFQVDTITGDASLKNTTSVSITLDGYSIVSSTNSLRSDTWQSLADQGLDNGSWEELVATSGALVETSPAGSITIAPGNDLWLGSLYDVNQPQTLEVEYTTFGAVSGNRSIPVEFGVFANPADFNTDGTVDTLDLTKWQEDYGQTTGSDADDDNDSDGADFLSWQRNFGAGTLTTVQALESPASPPAADPPPVLALAPLQSPQEAAPTATVVAFEEGLSGSLFLTLGNRVPVAEQEWLIEPSQHQAAVAYRLPEQLDELSRDAWFQSSGESSLGSSDKHLDSIPASDEYLDDEALAVALQQLLQ